MLVLYVHDLLICELHNIVFTTLGDNKKGCNKNGCCYNGCSHIHGCL